MAIQTTIELSRHEYGILLRALIQDERHFRSRLNHSRELPTRMKLENSIAEIQELRKQLAIRMWSERNGNAR